MQDYWREICQRATKRTDSTLNLESGVRIALLIISTTVTIGILLLFGYVEKPLNQLEHQMLNFQSLNSFLLSWNG